MHKHSAEDDKCAEIFFYSPRHSGSNVGNEYTSFFAQNHIKQVVVEKEG